MADSMTGYADSTDDAYWAEMAYEAGILIQGAEMDLGRDLSDGEKVDLILDNMSAISCSDCARGLINDYRL
jgi:hypothetical protein